MTGLPGPPAAGGAGPGTTPPSEPHTRRQAVLAVVAVLLLAGCLRAPITSVGPVLDVIGADTGAGAGLLGLLGALPLLGFALVSPVIHGPASRFGLERVVAVALAVLAAGIALRSLPVVGGLWAGTAFIGCAIAVGNVLAPAVIKRDQPGRIALLTACFTAVMSTFGALAAGLSVPLADASGGSWRLALGAWGFPVVVVAIWWTLRSRHGGAPRRGPGAGRRRRASGAGPARSQVSAGVGVVPDAPSRSVWRSAGAWQVTAFMGLQSGTFYILVTWLPSIAVTGGMTPAAAGWMLFVYQLVGIPAGLGVTRVMRRRTDLRALAVGVSLLMAGGATGLALAPGLTPLWVVLCALASGSTLVLSLSLFGLRTPTARQTAQLSGMAQSVGYLIAAGGPVLAGAVRDWTGAWPPAVGLVVAVAGVQGVVGLGAARPGYVQRG